MQHRSNRPQKRRLTPKQMQRLRRRRREERVLNTILTLLVLAIVLVAAYAVLKPEENTGRVDPAALMARETVAPTPTPIPTPVATPVPTPEPTPTPSPTPEPVALRSVRIRAAGDVMCSSHQLNYANTGSGYDFTPQLALISDALGDADYTMANLETTIGMYKGRAYSGYPRFNSPEALLAALENAGVDFLSLANNHMLDRWFDGMKNTVASVEAYGFDHTGAFVSQEARDTAKLVELNGIRFGFVAYTQTTNGMEHEADEAAVLYGVPYLEGADVAGDIERLRDAGADVVVAIPHWGTEYAAEPDDTQLKYARSLALAGADVVLGSHPHVVQRLEFFPVAKDDGSTRNVLIAYSLGNFLSTQKQDDAMTDAGMILEFTVTERSDGTFVVGEVGYVPTYSWVHDGNVQTLPSSAYLTDPPAGMSDAEFVRMKETYYALTELLGDFEVLPG